MRNKWIMMIAVAVLVMVFMPLGSVQAAPQKVIKIKMVGTLPIGHHLTTALIKYKEYVEQKSNGRVVVELYPAQQLYNDKDLVTVLPKGGVDMAIANLDMWAGLVPAIGFFYMPLIFDDEDHWFRVFYGRAGDILREELEKRHCKALAATQYGTSDLMFRTPVATLEDMRGKRVRAFGEYTSYFLQSLGMAPVMMSSGEYYAAMQRGTIDGVMSGLTSFNSRKLYEVGKHVPDVVIQPVVLFMTIANLKFYNSLPKDIQKILSDGAKEIENYTRKAAAEDTIKARKVLLANGVTLKKISNAELERWRKIAVPVMKAKYKENYDPRKADLMFDSLEKERK
ncbi:hypothetical protein KN63_05705 [Smithella sp. F21]|nr:hypothetical protein KN63_05705 [Smithella sp. F21]